MKAWIIEDTNDYDKGKRLVFADTVAQAKNQAYTDNGRIYHGEALNPDNWVDIRSTRAKYADNMENDSEISILTNLIKNGWWLSIKGITYNDDNVEELVALAK